MKYYKRNDMKKNDKNISKKIKQRANKNLFYLRVFEKS